MNEPDHFQYNLNCIERRFPAAFEKLRLLPESGPDASGRPDVFGLPGEFPNLVLSAPDGESVFFHRLEDPLAEARQIISGIDPGRNIDAFFILGFGAGYHIEALLETLHPEIPVIIIEKDPALFREVLRLRSYRAIWDRSKLWLTLDESVQDSTFYALSQFYNISPRPGFQILSVKTFQYFLHHVYMHLFRDYYQEVITNLDTIAEAAGDNVETFRQFIELWGDNLVTNARHFLFNPGVNKLRNQFTGIPAVVVAAGPSLDKNIAALKEARDRCLIISVDTSLKMFQAHGFEPHFVLSVDGQKINCTHYDGVTLNQTYLVGDTVSHPDILNRFGRRMFICTSGHPLNVFLEDTVENKGFLAGSGSVATSCFALALLMGCDPVIFVGQDLAYSGWRTHTKISGYQKMSLNKLNRFLTLADLVIDFKATHRETTVKGNYEAEVPTSRIMKRWKTWLEDRISEMPDRRFINATEGGACIANTSVATLRQTVADYCPPLAEPVRERLERIHHESFSPPTREFLLRLNETMAKLKDIEKLAGRGRDLLKKKEHHPRLEKERINRVNMTAKQITGNKLFMKLSQWDVEPLITGLMDNESGMQKTGGFNDEAFRKVFCGVQAIAAKLRERLKTIHDQVEPHIR